MEAFEDYILLKRGLTPEVLSRPYQLHTLAAPNTSIPAVSRTIPFRPRATPKWYQNHIHTLQHNMQNTNTNTRRYPNSHSFLERVWPNKHTYLCCCLWALKDTDDPRLKQHIISCMKTYYLLLVTLRVFFPLFVYKGNTCPVSHDTTHPKVLCKSFMWTSRGWVWSVLWAIGSLVNNANRYFA